MEAKFLWNRLMRGTFSLVLILFLLQGGVTCGAADSKQNPKTATGPAPKGSDPIVRTINDLVNAYRASQGLEPLTLNPFLSEIAGDHSRDMAKGKVEFGHKGFEQRARTVQQKIRFRSIAENVGASIGQADPYKVVVEGWLRSPGHLKNIKGDFELTGIGVAKSRKGMYYFTQIFVKKLQ